MKLQGPGPGDTDAQELEQELSSTREEMEQIIDELKAEEEEIRKLIKVETEEVNQTKQEVSAMRDELA